MEALIRLRVRRVRGCDDLRVPGTPPLVLLHGLGMSPRVWDRVRPLLEPHHDVVPLVALGHRGGARATRRPVKLSDIVDATERASTSAASSVRTSPAAPWAAGWRSSSHAEGEPGARSLVLPRVGHVPMIDDPGAVARAILDVTTPDRPPAASPR